MSGPAASDFVGTIVLAAGESSRLGQPKQLLPFAGATLLEHAVTTALRLQCGPVIVVLGAYAEIIRPVLEKLPVQVAVNGDWREGMGASIRTGLLTLLASRAKPEAALITLCDQPLVTTEALASLIGAWRATRPPVAAARYAGVLGVPAVFDSALFEELLGLPGAEGARPVIRRHAGLAHATPIDAAAIDIDTAAQAASLYVNLTSKCR